MLHVVDRLIEHDCDVVVPEGIDDAPALPPGSDEIEMKEKAQLVGDG
jgi:hypothetical protein